jgi:hypothetical protein
MALSGWGRSGIALLVVGILVALWAQQGLGECQTTAGQVGQAVSEQLQQQCENRRTFRLGGIAMAVVGGGLFLNDAAGGIIGSSGKKSTTVMSEPSIKNFVVSPGEFDYVEFGITDESKLSYSIEVVNGPGVNVIVTYRRHLNEFRESTDIGWVEKASAVNVQDAQKDAILTPGDYVVIIDNTGRFGDQTAEQQADVTLKYRIS